MVSGKLAAPGDIRAIRGVNYLSVRGYTLAIMYGLDKPVFESISDRVIAFPVALVGAVLVTGFSSGCRCAD